MTQRTVTVVLRAVTNPFERSFAQAGKSAQTLQAELSKKAQANAKDMRDVGQRSMLMGGAVLAGVGLAVKSFASFDKEMSNVKAVSNASAGEIAKLRQAAIVAGQATKYSAGEAAKAEAELAKAGVSTADILGGALKGSLDLAAAGNLDLADAATISAQAMNIFKLKGSDVGHIADVLAAGANKSAADVSTLGDALRQGGLLAAQTGLSLEDTVGTLSAFADNALVGSDAGTSLKTMLQRLVPQSQQAADAMKKIGFSAYDSQGNFIGLEGVAQKLKDGLGGLSAEQRNSALATIFGSDAVRAANILYEQGAAGIHDYVSAVNDQGAASRMAATQMDNLAGDIEQLKGSLETALIQSGSSANAVLRDMTQAATGAVNAYSGLPGNVQGSVTALAAVGGVAALAGGAFLVAAPRIVETRKALATLNTEMPRTTAGLRTLGKAVAVFATLQVAGTVIGSIGRSAEDAAPGVQDMTSALLGLSDASVDKKFTDSTLNGFTDAIRKLTDPSNKERLDDLGGSVLGVFGIGNGKGRFERQAILADLHSLDQALAGMVSDGNADTAAQKFNLLAAKAATVGVSSKQLMALFPGYKDALAGAANKTALAAGNTSDLAGAQGDLNDAVGTGTIKLEDYKSALDSLNGVNLTAAQQQLALEKSITAATKAADGHKKVSDDEKSALYDLADQALQTADAIAQQTGSVDKGNDSLAASRKAFIKAAEAMGYSKKEAQALADQFLQLPTAKSTTIKTPGMAAAKTSTNVLQDKLNRLEGIYPVRVSVRGVDQALADLARVNSAVHMLGNGTVYIQMRGGKASYNATGGYISGPGTGTSDSIPAMLSNGEFVINAAATRENRGLLEAINSGADFSRGYATGGMVTAAAPAAAPVYGGDTYNLHEVRDARESARQIADRQREARFRRTGRWG